MISTRLARVGALVSFFLSSPKGLSREGEN